MNLQELILGKLAEECAELAKVCMKAQQFGLDDISPCEGKTNREMMLAEMVDILGVMQMAHELGVGVNIDTENTALQKAITRKKVKTAYYARQSTLIQRLDAHPKDLAYLEKLMDDSPEITREVYLKHSNDVDRIAAGS